MPNKLRIGEVKFLVADPVRTIRKTIWPMNLAALHKSPSLKDDWWIGGRSVGGAPDVQGPSVQGPSLLSLLSIVLAE